MAGSDGEFQLIDRLLKPLATHPASLGLTDDAAVLTPGPGQQMVLTKDMLVEGVHFRRDEAPADVAAKALRVNLSDLAAMGARPVAYLMALSLDPDKRGDWLADFVQGLADDQMRYGLSLIGGDMTATPGPMTVSITALGEVPDGQAVKRSTARPGDAILVSGTIGDAALGLALARGDIIAGDGTVDAHLMGRYRRPQPRTALAALLREMATAAIDVSDGLAADLGHIARESQVRAVIEAERVPLSAEARRLLDGAPGLLPLILSGGDDYELVMTVAPGNLDRIREKAADVHIPLTLLGHIEAGEGVAILDAGGREIVLDRPGFRHF
jgi:thiamine-monophosphate kinase